MRRPRRACGARARPRSGPRGARPVRGTGRGATAPAPSTRWCSAAHAPRSAHAPPRSEVSAAVTHTIRSASSSAGCTRVAVPSSSSSGRSSGDSASCTCDRAAEGARLGRGDDGLLPRASGAAFEPAGDEDRAALARHPERLQLLDDCAERGAARIVGRVREAAASGARRRSPRGLHGVARAASAGPESG